MVLALLALALADDNAPSAMDVQDCGPGVEMLYPRDGEHGVALDAVPTVLVSSPECGRMDLDLVLLADGEVVAERSVETDGHLVQLDAELDADTEYQFMVFVGGNESPEGESTFSTGGRPGSPAVASPEIVRGVAVMYDEEGPAYVEVTLAPVRGATVVGLAAWDGVGEVGEPSAMADASAQRSLGVSVLGPRPGDEVCVGAMARGLDGSWSAATTECFLVTQGWSDEEETWVDDHDHACNAASAAMGLAPILLGTLGILRRRAR